MKKFIVSLVIFICLFTGSAFAIQPVLEFSVNASTPIKIYFPDSYPVYTYIVSTKNGEQVYLSNSADFTTSYLTKEDWEYSITPRMRDKGLTVFWVKSLSGQTATIQILSTDD